MQHDFMPWLELNAMTQNAAAAHRMYQAGGRGDVASEIMPSAHYQMQASRQVGMPAAAGFGINTAAFAVGFGADREIGNNSFFGRLTSAERRGVIGQRQMAGAQSGMMTAVGGFMRGLRGQSGDHYGSEDIGAVLNTLANEGRLSQRSRDYAADFLNKMREDPATALRQYNPERLSEILMEAGMSAAAARGTLASQTAAGLQELQQAGLLDSGAIQLLQAAETASDMGMRIAASLGHTEHAGAMQAAIQAGLLANDADRLGAIESSLRQHGAHGIDARAVLTEAERMASEDRYGALGFRELSAIARGAGGADQNMAHGRQLWQRDAAAIESGDATSLLDKLLNELVAGDITINANSIKIGDIDLADVMKGGASGKFSFGSFIGTLVDSVMGSVRQQTTGVETTETTEAD